jgi:hypothetical protein
VGFVLASRPGVADREFPTLPALARGLEAIRTGLGGELAVSRSSLGRATPPGGACLALRAVDADGRLHRLGYVFLDIPERLTARVDPVHVLTAALACARILANGVRHQLETTDA